MKMFLLGLILTAPVFAQSVSLPAYRDYKLTDIVKKGLTKEKIFKDLDRTFVKINSSICSNRVLMWSWDMKRAYGIDTAKVFMFYTNKTGEVGSKTWWYHVAPVVNQQGKLWVVDGGFPGKVDAAMSIPAWQKKFVGETTSCREIKAHETELIKRMFSRRVYPPTTEYGSHDCYHIVVPAGYWTPISVAQNLLGVNEHGRPVRFIRDRIDRGELMAACVEASTTKLGRIFVDEQKQCTEYLER